MKRFLVLVFLCLGLSGFSAAQQTSSDAPASKEDIERYLQVMHSHDMMVKTVEAMAKPMHDMVHQRYLKDRDKLPADFEARMNKEMDELMKSFPWDEMLDAMVPVYQKHFTKGDVDALVAFYSGPTGQKMLQELPAITAETMATIMPMIQKSVDSMHKCVQGDIAAMIKESEAKPGNTSPKTNN
jgi:hypothetical protein